MEGVKHSIEHCQGSFKRFDSRRRRHVRKSGHVSLSASHGPDKFLLVALPMPRAERCTLTLPLGSLDVLPVFPLFAIHGVPPSHPGPQIQFHVQEALGAALVMMSLMMAVMMTRGGSHLVSLLVWHTAKRYTTIIPSSQVL